MFRKKRNIVSAEAIVTAYEQHPDYTFAEIAALLNIHEATLANRVKELGLSRASGNHSRHHRGEARESMQRSEPSPSQFSEALRQIRISERLSQSGFAEKLGVTPDAIKRSERYGSAGAELLARAIEHYPHLADIKRNVCPECGRNTKKTFRYCPECGTAL